MNPQFKRLNPSFARLLSSENIKVAVGTSQQAYFDLKKRLLHVPNWGLSTEAVMDMVVGHEVGHALFTGQTEWRHGMEVAGIKKSILNIVEDSRIEKLVQRKFPGLKRDFAQGYFYLHNELDLFGIRRVDVNKLSFADRYNLHFKVGPMSGVSFRNDREREMIALGEQLETWNDVLALSQMIQKYCEETKQEVKPNQPQGDGSKTLEETLSEEPKGEEPAKAPPPETDSEIDEEEEESVAAGESEDLADELGTTTPAESKKEIDNTRDDKDYSEAGVTDENLRENEEKLVEAGGNYEQDKYDTSQSIGKQTFEMKAVERKYVVDGEIRAVIQANKKAINDMVTEFERKKAAWKSKHATPSRTGRLDANKLASYKTNPNIFLNKKMVQNAKSHGVVVLLDNSGSMKPHWHSAISRAVEVAEFCSRVGIRCIVATFTHIAIDTSDKNWRDVEDAFGKAKLHFTPNLRTMLSAETLLRSMYDSGIQRCSLILITDGDESDESYSSGSYGRRANFMDATNVYDEVTNVSYVVPYPSSANWNTRREYLTIRSMQLYSVAIDMLKNRLGRQDLNTSMIMLIDAKRKRTTNKIFGSRVDEVYDNHNFNAIVRVPIKSMHRVEVDEKFDAVKWDSLSASQRRRTFSDAMDAAQGASFMYRIVAANIAKHF